jgi:hypothetical protein
MIPEHIPGIERALETRISCETLQCVLDGVAAAARVSAEATEPLRVWIASLQRQVAENPPDPQGPTFSELLSRAKSEFPEPGLA